MPWHRRLRRGYDFLDPRWARAARLVLTVCLIWALLGTFLALQIYFNARAGGRALPLGWIIGNSLRRYAIYALLTFPILWVCRRFPFDPRRLWTSLPAHAAACLGTHLTYDALTSLSAVDPETMTPVAPSLEVFSSIVRGNLFEVSWMYASIVFVAFTLQYRGRVREREIREADLRRQMAEYELQILRLQLHPHFLFNTLNGIATLMSRDVATAREMLLRLSDLLRIALSRSSEEEVPLRDEIAFVQAYLHLEQMRFGDRLAVRLDIEPDTLEARVPNMIIQPLVENAIRYGVEPLRDGGRIELAARRVDGTLSIRIVNDGPAASPGASTPGGLGIGLRSARSRLVRLHGDDGRVTLHGRAGGGSELSLEIPYRAAPRGAEGAA